MKHALVVTAAVSLVLASPSTTFALGGSAGDLPHDSVSARAAAARPAQGHGSTYLAGYRATAPDQANDVIVKAVNIPTITCDSKRFEGIALGAGSEPTVGLPEYLASVFVSCVDGQPTYLLDALAGSTDNQAATAPGNQAQIVITLNCQDGTCDVFSSITDLDTNAEVHSEAKVTPTTASATFGAFPLFTGDSLRPAPVPAFGSAQFLGCLFNDHGLHGAERLDRHRGRTMQIKTGRFADLSFGIKFTHH